MKYAYFFIALALLSSCTLNQKNHESIQFINSSDSLTAQEAEYLKTRDAYIEQFKPLQKARLDTLGKMDDRALLDLEKKLKEILKDAKYSGQGKINLETLQGYLGFGMLDGLAFEKDSMRIFYTTKSLFVKYFNIKEFNSEAFGGVFHSAFFSDAAVEPYFSMKMNSIKKAEAYGTVGFVTQMSGPYPPNHLFVLVSTEKYVYMNCKEILMEDLPNCKAPWDGSENGGSHNLGKL